MKRPSSVVWFLLLGVFSLSACAGLSRGGIYRPASVVAMPGGVGPSSPTPPPTSTNTPSPTATHTPTATTVPTQTPMPVASATPTATPTATATLAPTATPDPATLVNGVPVELIAVMPPETRDNVRRIFERGQTLGRNPHAFSKLGDSISLTSHYLARFDQRRYHLGVYRGLQPAVDFYRKSYERFGVAMRIGLHAWAAFRPGIADVEKCRPEEHMVECEFRLHNPSVLLVRLGTNDIAPGDAFERAMRYTIEYAIRNGVIPVLGTKADRFEGDNRHNETLRQLAAEYHVPLWDFDLVAGTLPDHGLGGDSVHMTMYAANDYSDPATLQFGYPLSDLTGLMVLNQIRQIVTEEQAD